MGSNCKLRLREIEKGDLDLIIERLRPEDRYHAEKVLVPDLVDAIACSVYGLGGKAQAVVAGEKLVAVCGTRVTGLRTAKVWLLCTEDIRDYRVSGMKLAKECLRNWTAEYGTLWNMAEVSEVASLDFVETLGAWFAEPRLGPGESTFAHFSFSGEDL